MNGVLNVLKPPAMTSSDVVARIRRMLGERRVGHTGTLDPGAAGVLPVCVGRATKIADYIMSADKEYIAEICFGTETDTQDSYGVVTAKSDQVIARRQLEEILPQFTGRILQKPPMYSAIKHEGKKLYELARKGVEVAKPAREVTVGKIEILGEGSNRFLLKINCSKGTYIRSLCADIGHALGNCAYVSFLMRTETGGYGIKQSHTLDELEELHSAQAIRQALIPIEQALGGMPKVVCGDYLYDILTTGTPIDLRKAGTLKIDEAIAYAVYCKDTLIGIGKRAGDTLKIVTMLKLREG